MKTRERYEELLKQIELHQRNGFTCLIGLDGFVDEVVHVVDKRIDSDTYSRIRTIREYGERILEGSRLSLNIEIVPILKKIGGNGPVYANGLKKYGAELTYIGCTGEENPNAVFKELAEGSRIIGVAEPGQTDAMEFADGKIIRSKTDALNKLTWEKIIDKIPAEELAVLFAQSDLLSFNNWTMIPHMSEIWRHMLTEVVPRVDQADRRKVLFFDLADPRKRRGTDILEALELIRQFQQEGFRTMLGLNEKEARQIASLLTGGENAEMDLRNLVVKIAEFMNIETVVVHPVERAACCQNGVYYEVEGPYCSDPVLTTGAGDVFNSGFVWGQVQGLEPELCLLMGVMSSGFYVRNGKSADLKEIDSFIEAWRAGLSN